MSEYADKLGLEVRTAHRCVDCEAIIDPADWELGPLYECSCGTRFTRESSADGSGHRCPDCNKFGARAADLGCPECNEGELLEMEVVRCFICDDLIDLDAFDSHLTCSE